MTKLTAGKLRQAAMKTNCFLLTSEETFGVDGTQPLVGAYWNYSVDMVRHLLERESNPNYNSYRSDDVIDQEHDSTGCAILSLIEDDLFLSDDEDVKNMATEIYKIVRQYGGWE